MFKFFFFCHSFLLIINRTKCIRHIVWGSAYLGFKISYYGIIMTGDSNIAGMSIIMINVCHYRHLSTKNYMI